MNIYDEPLRLQYIVQNLLWVLFGCNGTANYKVEHRCMSTYENSADIIEYYGLGKDTGYCVELNDKGIEFYNKDLPEWHEVTQ